MIWASYQLLGEMKRAINRMKYRKPPGINGIPAELFQKLNDKNLEVVLDPVCRYWSEPDFDSLMD
jgi:hypothetical protein